MIAPCVQSKHIFIWFFHICFLFRLFKIYLYKKTHMTLWIWVLLQRLTNWVPFHKHRSELLSFYKTNKRKWNWHWALEHKISQLIEKTSWKATSRKKTNFNLLIGLKSSGCNWTYCRKTASRSARYRWRHATTNSPTAHPTANPIGYLQ